MRGEKTRKEKRREDRARETLMRREGKRKRNFQRAVLTFSNCAANAARSASHCEGNHIGKLRSASTARLMMLISTPKESTKDR